MEATDTCPQNLKEFLISLKSVLSRNVAYKPCAIFLQSPRQRTKNSREFMDDKSQALPTLVLKFSILGLAGEKFHVFSCTETCPSLNPTWHVPETAWLSIPSDLKLEFFTKAVISIFAEGVLDPLHSTTLVLNDLVILPFKLHQLQCLPINTVLFELSSGKIFAMKSVVDEIVIGSSKVATPSHTGSAIDSYLIPSIPGPIYNLDEIEALERLRATVDAAESRAKELYQQLESSKKNSRTEKLKQQLCHNIEISVLKERFIFEKSRLEREESAAEFEREELLRHMALLENLSKKEVFLKNEQVGLSSFAKKEQIKLNRVNCKVGRREYELAASLRKIYPIRYENISGGYSIGNVLLDLESRDDETLSAALGYTAHLTALLAKYLNVNLRYHIHYGASRSAIRDAILGTPPYPLFKRGVEADRFDRGIIYLTRNVDQLLASRGLNPPTRAKNSGGGGGLLLVSLQYLLAECAVLAELPLLAENATVQSEISILAENLHTSTAELPVLGDDTAVLGKYPPILTEDSFMQSEMPTLAESTNVLGELSNLPIATVLPESPVLYKKFPRL